MSYVGETFDILHVSTIYLSAVLLFAFPLYMPLVNKQRTLWTMKIVKLKPYLLLIILVI